MLNPSILAHEEDLEVDCEVCGRQIDRSNETELCHTCHELVEREEKREEVREERVKRRCLRCDQTFWAQGKFNRICPNCAQKNRNVAHLNRYEVRLMKGETKPEQTGSLIATRAKVA